MNYFQNHDSKTNNKNEMNKMKKKNKSNIFKEPIDTPNNKSYHFLLARIFKTDILLFSQIKKPRTI